MGHGGTETRRSFCTHLGSPCLRSALQHKPLEAGLQHAFVEIHQQADSHPSDPKVSENLSFEHRFPHQDAFGFDDDPSFNDQIDLIVAQRLAAILERNLPLALEPQAVMRELETKRSLVGALE
jgi:hypothetical protein